MGTRKVLFMYPCLKKSLMASHFLSFKINMLSSLYGAYKRFKKQQIIIKSIFALFVGNSGVSILGAIGGLLVARFIGPEVNGQFRIYTIPMMYLAFLQLGTFQGIQREIPYYTGLGHRDYVNKVASVAGAWSICVAALISSAFLGCSIFELFHHNVVAAAGWLSQAFFCWTVYYGGYLSNTFRTANNFVIVARIEFLQALLFFVLVFAVPFMQIYGLFLRASIPSIICLLIYHRYRPLPVPLKFDFFIFKDILKIGLPLCFWQSINTSLWLAAETTLMLYLGGVKALGLFSVAIVCRVSVSALPQAIFQVLKPRIAEAYGRKGRIGKDLQYYSLLAAALSAFMFIIVSLVAYLLDHFIPILIPKYVEGIQLIKICNFVAVVHAASLPLNGLFAIGRGWLIGKGIFAGFITFLFLVYFLTPSVGGMLSVAVGSLVGNVVWVAVGYIDVIKMIRNDNIKKQ